MSIAYRVFRPQIVDERDICSFADRVYADTCQSGFFDDYHFNDTLDAIEFLERQGYVVEQAQYWEL